jgi:acyl transferase domain-containing protein/acyl carrier protein
LNHRDTKDTKKYKGDLIKISARIANMSSVKLALLAKQMRAQVEDVLDAEPIAIIGMGCRFPGGADNPAAYWELLKNKVDAVAEIPADRWDIDSLYDADFEKPGKMSTRWGGFISDVAGFDPTFFGIAPREARQMDPQQRLFLEVAYEALEDAGQLRDQLAGSQTGVFVSSYHNDYALMEYADARNIDARTITGTLHSIVPNRLSFLLNLRGPSLNIDTACSSSLVAVHLACQSLRTRESDLALAGGVNLIISPDLNISLSKGGFMSPDGHCRAFDAGGNGFVRGEGCGVVVLKRLSDALTDGDHILALARGSAVNQDGRSNVLTAPNGPSQEAVLRQAWQNAGIEPWQISHIEAHGTGTALGDPIEVEALANVIGAPRGQQVALTSVKTNIGHLEAAAGIAGLIKIVLSMQHGEIPPIIHFTKLNPYISLDNTPFVIPTEVYPWPAGDQPRFAGVSSFGVGGTNAHAILEEAPVLNLTPTPSPSNGDGLQTTYILPLSGHNENALIARAGQFRDLLATGAITNLRDVVYTASAKRNHYDTRAAVFGQTPEQMVEQLDALLRGEMRPESAAGQVHPVKLTFVFSGQGPQWWAMGRQLLESEPVFREMIEKCDALFKQYAPWSLLAELTAEENKSRLDQTEIAQPAIFALQVALAAMWRSWGIVPEAVVGHSIGEIAAAHVGGILSLEDAVKIAFHRGRLMQQATGFGKMAAVELPANEAQKLIAPYADKLSVAAINSPTSCVISGEPQALEAVLREIEQSGVYQKMMRVNYAFHSPQMQPFQGEMTKAIPGIKTQKSAIPVYSTVRGGLSEAGDFGTTYWARNIREAVRFADTLKIMSQAGYNTFLEISPHPVLAKDMEQTLNGQGVILSSLRRNRDERATMLSALGGLYAQGLNPDWKALYPDGGGYVALPTYPWQRQRYWLEISGHKQTPIDENAHPLLGRQIQSPALEGTVFESQLSAEWPPFLNDHRIFGTAILPATAYLEMALSAADALGAGPHALENVAILEALPLPDEGERTVQVILKPHPQPLSINGEGSEITFQLVSRNENGDWRHHAEGRIQPHPQPLSIHSEGSTGHDGAPLQNAQNRCNESLSVDEHYRRNHENGLEFGAGFRGLEQIWRGDGETLGYVRLPDDLANDAGRYHIHPALLDSALQVLSAALPDDALYLPVSVDKIQIFETPGVTLWSHAQINLTPNPSPNSERGDLFSGNVSLYDDAGTLIAKVIGQRFKRTSREALQHATQEKPDWLYDIVWRESPPQYQPQTPGEWLVLADSEGVGEELAALLHDNGENVAVVAHGQDFDPIIASKTWRGVIYLRALGESTQEVICGGALEVAQALVKNGNAQALWLVTQRAMPVADTAISSVAQATLWGFANTLALEYPDLRCVRVDLDSTDGSHALLQAISANDNEDRIAFRDGKRYVARLAKATDVGAQRAAPLQGTSVTLDITERGVFDNLTLRPTERRAPGPGEVEIRVNATGLNFRDVLKALGVYPGDLSFFGDECAGEVVAVGEGIDHLQVGDHALGIVANGFSTYLTTHADFLVHMPENLTFEEAATIPVTFLTAYYSLHHLGHMQAGERVLIHAAAGGVGMAAVQLALQAGAEVFATAGNDEKRGFLRSMGVQHIMDSRSLDFADEIMTLTNGEGIDLVLNSLAGDFIPKSLSVLRAGGRFLEIGKTDIWNAEQVAAFNPGVDYHVIFLADLYDSQPDLIRAMLLDVVEAVETGALSPLPHQDFPITDVVSAFRYMAQARHIGKIVVTQPHPQPLPEFGEGRRGGVIQPDATYLITGGLGGLGLLAARWLVDQGARHVALMGRNAPSDSAHEAIREMEAAGAQIFVAQGDVAHLGDTTQFLSKIVDSMPPLRGIIHTAGVNDDGVLLQQDWSRFEKVMSPKVDGTWNLHLLTLDLPLEFFISFSSIAANLGSVGQINYAAANAYLDGFAHWRRAQGLPATSINWGAWDNVGMTARLDNRDTQRHEKQGIGIIPAESGMQALGEILQRNPAQITVSPINWRVFESSAPLFSEMTREKAAPREPELRRKLNEAPPSKYRSILQAHIREQAMIVLGLPSSMTIDARQPLNELGLDSLMAVELRNALGRSVGATLPATLLFDYPVIDALADYLANDVLKLQSIAEKPAEEVPDAKAQAAAEMNELTDEEAEALLLQELMNPKKKGR